MGGSRMYMVNHDVANKGALASHVSSLLKSTYSERQKLITKNTHNCVEKGYYGVQSFIVYFLVDEVICINH